MVNAGSSLKGNTQGMALLPINRKIDTTGSRDEASFMLSGNLVIACETAGKVLVVSTDLCGAISYGHPYGGI